VIQWLMFQKAGIVDDGAGERVLPLFSRKTALRHWSLQREVTRLFHVLDTQLSN
jgi:hypothetical protein